MKILILFLLFNSSIVFAKVAHKTTTYSKCTRDKQAIIVAMETLRESDCHRMGKFKARQYTGAGWSCAGKNNEDLYSCEAERASAFATYKGTYLDNLTFTNLHQRRSLLAYINPDSNQLCHEDQAELTASGVKDAICHKRRK